MRHATSRVDPLLDIQDKLPLRSSGAAPADDALGDTSGNAVPFGVRFAVAAPVHAGKHGKTYYTVTEIEPTYLSEDGKTVTHDDSVQRERED